MGGTVKVRDREVAEVLQETLGAVRYLTDERGSRTDVVLSLDRWERLIAWLETLDDRLALEEWLPVLRGGPRQTGVLPWRDVADEWLSEDV